MQGYERKFRPRRGGVKAVVLVDAALVAGVEYDPSAEGWRSIALQPGAAFAAMGLPEDQGTFEQAARRVDGCLQVTQRLTLPLEGFGEREIAAMKELSAAGVSSGGVSSDGASIGGVSASDASAGGVSSSGIASGVACADGLVALVQTNDGAVLVGGCSRRLGLESPLRLAGIESTTKADFSQTPLQTIVLESVSDQPADPYIGSLEGIFL